MTTMRVVGECFFWYRLTRVFPDKFHRAVKRLCVVCCLNCQLKFDRDYDLQSCRISGEESWHVQSRFASSGPVINIQVLHRPFPGRFVHGMCSLDKLQWTLHCMMPYFELKVEKAQMMFCCHIVKNLANTLNIRWMLDVRLVWPVAYPLWLLHETTPIMGAHYLKTFIGLVKVS